MARDPFRTAEEEQERAWDILITCLCLLLLAGLLFVFGYTAWWFWTFITTDV
jgi:hypothetical protein